MPNDRNEKTPLARTNEVLGKTILNESLTNERNYAMTNNLMQGTSNTREAANKSIDDIKPNEAMVFPDMSVAVVYMMHKYITVFDYKIDTPTKANAIFSLIDQDGAFKAELLANGKVVDFGKGYEEYTTKQEVLDFYTQSAAFVQKNQSPIKVEYNSEPKVFDSYYEAYFILNCYYHQLLGYELVVPENIQSGVLITLEKDTSIIELIEGWQILEDGEPLTNDNLFEISELKEIRQANHPRESGWSMGAFGAMRYWHLETQTMVVIAKREKAKRVKTYLMHNPISNLYKIGKSINPEQRAIDIQGMAGNPLKLLYVIHENVEHELHTKFASQNYYSEWFTDECGSIRAYFKSKSESSASTKGVCRHEY